MPIQQDLARCIADTRQYISHQAANCIAPWVNYPQEQLITSIQNVITIQANQANGFLIHASGGVSLECIVITYQNLFTEDDIRIARQTLGQQTCDR